MTAEKSRVDTFVADALIAEAPSAHPLIGTTLRGTYFIHEALDEGGMGMVFVAEHVRLKRKLAVKVLAKHLSEDPHALARFHREAEIISQINHPCIVHVVDFDATDDGEPYLVMELLRGESLESRLERDRRIGLVEALRITTSAASGLTAAHDVNIVHRDLKPGNIFLMDVPGQGSFVKLLDFGISKLVGAARGLTGEFDILGTPDYMAPEQASGRTALVDHRGDQFALGIISYQMLTGALPFAGNDVMEVLRRVLHDTPCPPSKINAELPEAIDLVLARALNKAPEDRYPSINEFAAELERAAGVSLPPPFSMAPQRSSPGGAWPSEEPATGVRGPLTPKTLFPTLDAKAAASASLTPPRVTGTHSKGRGRLISSALVEAVDDFLEQAREALERDDFETAVTLAEEALDLAHTSEDTLARRSVEGAETLLVRIFEQRLGRLSRIVEIDASTRAGSLSPEQAFVLSRLEGGVTFDEVLDLTPLPRQRALRHLVQLLRGGWIRVP